MGTRTALLDSAERVARERGFDGFSYADLSNDVGIRKASIHHHFPTKADLALAVVERYCRRFLDYLRGVAESNARAADRLTAYVDAYRAALSDGETLCLCVAFSSGRDSLSEPVLAELNRFRAHNIDWLMETFLTGKADQSIDGVTDARAEASACLALVEGGQLMARTAADVSLFDAATAALAARIR